MSLLTFLFGKKKPVKDVITNTTFKHISHYEGADVMESRIREDEQRRKHLEDSLLSDIGTGILINSMLSDSSSSDSYSDNDNSSSSGFESGFGGGDYSGGGAGGSWSDSSSDSSSYDSGSSDSGSCDSSSSSDY